MAQSQKAAKNNAKKAASKNGQQIAASASTSTPKPNKTKEEPQQQSKFTIWWDSFWKRMQDTWAEIQKITWPDRETVRNLTILVILMATIMGIFLGAIDWILLKLFEAI